MPTVSSSCVTVLLLLALLFIPANSQENDESTTDIALAHCGCSICTEQVWQTIADGFSCGQRILSLQDQDGKRLNKVDACVQVAEQFPDQCGSCNTNTCPDGVPLHCGCGDCSNEIWASQAGKFTCGDRILYLQTVHGGSLSQGEACETVASQFLGQCGPCNPRKCDGQKPLFCGCNECTREDLSDRMAGTYSCGDRVESLMREGYDEEDACQEVFSDFPSKCSPRCNPVTCDGRTNAPTPTPPVPPTLGPNEAPTAAHCQCHKCTENVWERSIRISPTGASTTCGQHISDLMAQNGAEATAACASVAANYQACASCHPNCNVEDSLSLATSNDAFSRAGWAFLFCTTFSFFGFMVFVYWRHKKGGTFRCSRQGKPEETKQNADDTSPANSDTPEEASALEEVPRGP